MIDYVTVCTWDLDCDHSSLRISAYSRGSSQASGGLVEPLEAWRLVGWRCLLHMERRVQI